MHLLFAACGNDSHGLPWHASPHSNSLALKFRFNAWAKYANWRHDEKVGALMAKATAQARERPSASRPDTRIVLEGGSIDVNGAGTILTTEECLLSKVQERNPHMARIHYEKAFADYFGVPHTIWLGRGIEGDDTHGHVDDLTRFVAPDTVITMVEPNIKRPEPRVPARKPSPPAMRRATRMASNSRLSNSRCRNR